MKKNSALIITGVVALIIGLSGGYYFRSHQLTKMRGNFVQGDPQRFKGGPQGGDRMFGRPVQGDILSVDEKGITVKLLDGSSKIILFSDSTSINKSTVGAKSDLKVNSKVMVTGNVNSDGSITATSVQLTNDGK